MLSIFGHCVSNVHFKIQSSKRDSVVCVCRTVTLEYHRNTFRRLMVLVMITNNDQTMVSGEKNEVNVSSLCKKKSHTIGDDNGLNT